MFLKKIISATHFNDSIALMLFGNSLLQQEGDQCNETMHLLAF